MRELVGTLENRDVKTIATVQQKIIDACAEMIAKGGHDDDVNAIIRAAIRHKFRSVRCGGTIARDVLENFDQWRKELKSQWPKNGAVPEALTSKTVADCIRFNVRGELRDCFERFLGSADPEEIWFLLRVMSMRDNLEYEGDLPIATAYDDAFRNHTRAYIRIPEHMTHEVVQYVEKLIAAERDPDSARASAA
jgi:hypothetical protein